MGGPGSRARRGATWPTRRTCADDPDTLVVPQAGEVLYRLSEQTSLNTGPPCSGPGGGAAVAVELRRQ